MEFKELEQLAKSEKELSEKVFNELVEFLGYNSTGMRVTITRTLKIYKDRIERGEEISFFKTGEVLDFSNLKDLILATFGEEVCEDVFEVEEV